MKIEFNGINFIQESERQGSPRDLFWPWCGANVSLLALSYGAFFLGFGISFLAFRLISARPVYVR